MLPVSAWPPGPPGASLSPFGPPRMVRIGPHGFVIPKGAWVVQTAQNRVVMFRPDWRRDLACQPTRQMGTGLLPGQFTYRAFPRDKWWLWRRPTHDEYLEGWRAWQRRVGRTDPPIRPLPGRVPPNWAGWRFTRAPGKTLIPFGQSGLIVADGQNVVIQGGGFATITQAYSV